MDRNSRARGAQLRAIRVFTKRPDYARSQSGGVADLRDGLSCRYQEGGRVQMVDMPSALGGDDAAPTPGFFGRAAISSCIAIGIKMMATREGITVDQVRVHVTQEWDNRGVLAMAGADASCRTCQVSVELSSRESEPLLHDLVARALTVDPWFLTYRDSQPIDVSVAVTEGAF